MVPDTTMLSKLAETHVLTLGELRALVDTAVQGEAAISRKLAATGDSVTSSLDAFYLL